ncbi:MAG: hypothetical protein NZM42_11975 [Gemmatales bacterium]|nr:hypothetical protein [Gemmatales bacterium]
MKRLLNIGAGLLGLLALGVLTVALALTFEGLRRDEKPASQVFQSPIETPIQPPYPPPATPTLPAPPTAPVPPCTFGGQPAPVEPGYPLEAYRFSEPQIVLTHPAAIGIAGWLPDGQHLLITRQIPGQPRESVEVFDMRTGEVQRYGERHSLPGKPVWLAAHQAVAFADVGPDKQVVLRISRGETGSMETPVSDLGSSFLAASPDGSQVVFFTQATPDRPEALDFALAQRQIFPALPLTLWQDLSALGQQYGPEPYQAVWSPSGNQIAFYNDAGFYLVDWSSGKICEVNLGFEEGETRYGKRWAFYAQWAPNGRYLAMLTTVGDLPIKFSDLIILDTLTDERHLMLPVVYLNPGQYYVQDMTWAPNSQVLAILATVEHRDGTTWEGLYLVEGATGRTEPMLPHVVFPAGDAGWNLAWSPNGNFLAVTCLYGPLCLIEATLP